MLSSDMVDDGVPVVQVPCELNIPEALKNQAAAAVPASQHTLSDKQASLNPGSLQSSQRAMADQRVPLITADGPQAALDAAEAAEFAEGQLD